MATDPIIPFNYLNAGPADSAKTGANFDEFLKYIRDRNDGTSSWDVLSVSGASTLTSPVTINGSGSTTELRINNTATDGDPVILWQLSGTSTFRAGIDDSASDIFEFGRGATFGTTTDLSISASSGAVTLRGTATNDSAATGFVGEAVRSAVADSAAVSMTGSDQYTDVTSISLTAGDWDVTGVIGFTANGATVNECRIGISSTSGNSGTGLSFGDNVVSTGAQPTASTDSAGYIPQYRVSISSTTTYYLKARMNYSVATPKAYGRISARRRR